MNFRRATFGVGLLGILAIPGCGGSDDTPTPDPDSGTGIMSTGAGGSNSSTDASGGTGGGSTSDGSASCKKTAAMAVTGQDIMACKAVLADANPDDAGYDCFSCLCLTCPYEAKSSGGKPFSGIITACCRAACNCPLPSKPEAGAPAGDAAPSDAPASDGPSSSDVTTTDATTE
jgi:hypothetical protein